MSDEQSNLAPAQEQQEPAQEAQLEQQELSSPENAEGQKEAIKEALDQGASQAEIKQMIKEYRLKVNGKEIVKKYKNDDELIRDLQLAEANKGGMQKSRELEKLFEREAKRLKDDPWSVLTELGHDPVKLSEHRLEQWVKEQEKSPEQREFEKMQRELVTAREEAKKLREESESSKMQNLKDRAAKEIEEEIDKALSSHTTLPKSRKTVTKIADALLWAMENGFPDASVADIIPVVEAEIKAEFNEFLENAPDEVFEAYVGQKKLESYRKKRVNAMKSASLPKNDIPQVSRPMEAKPSEKISMKDFFKNPEKYMKK